MRYPISSPIPDFMDLNIKLSSEQKMIEKSVRDFVCEKFEPIVGKAYREEDFPTEIIPEIAELGLLGANLTGYGLPGLDNISYGIIMKELERGDSGLRSFASVQGALVMYPIWAFGSEEQKKYWLPKLFKAEKIGCFGLTESEGGSDPSSMKTKVEETEQGFLLNGSKMWITNGNIADIAVVWAKTNNGIRGFLVPTDSKGVTVKKMTGKLSLRASITSELYFDNVELTKDAILPASQGLKSALSCLTQARYGIAWGVVGAAESCFSEACDYVSHRELFGVSLASKQIVQQKLALMLSKITQAQLLVHRLGEIKDNNNLHFSQVSMAKQNNCQIALEVSRSCRDILGANGIIDEYKSMRHMCNLETVYTYEGTNDIHLLILGSEITGINAF